MEQEFIKKVKLLMNEKDDGSGRSLLINDERYEEIISELKEAKEKKEKGTALTSKEYRRLKRFDIINNGHIEMLIQKPESQSTVDIKYFCRIDEMFNAIHTAHLKIGHKKEKAMEAELKKNFCNITREVIKIYLDLCESCNLKTKFKKKRPVVVKPVLIEALNSRCQVDLIDMQSEADGEYKFILNYQDHLTKFIVLRPLKSDTVDEVADILLDIFCLFGSPNILHSNYGREFCNQVIAKLTSEWTALKLVHGKPLNSQSQEYFERANQDIKDSLLAWTTDNSNTSAWANGLRIVQNTKNNSFNSEIKMTPYEALFGSPQKNGLLDSILTPELSNRIHSEEELEQELTLLQKSLNNHDDSYVDSTTERNDNTEELEQQLSASDDGEKSFEFAQDFYLRYSFEQAITSDLLPLGKSRSRKVAIETGRDRCEAEMNQQAHKMLKFPEQNLATTTSVSIGDNVLVSLPADVDSGHLAARKIMAVILSEDADDEEECHYRLGTRHGTLDKTFHRNQFQLIRNKFIDTSDVPDEVINVRKDSITTAAAAVASASKQAGCFVKCSCKKNCARKSCKCLKLNLKCSFKCHSSIGCANR